MKKWRIYFLCSIFAIVGLFFTPQNAFADPPVENPETTVTAPGENPGSSAETPAEQDATCYDQVGAIGWLVCPATGAIAKGIDATFGIISSLLQVTPISTDQNSPIHLVWEYIRNITNIIFIILLLVVVYSQVTGLGITNYGIKKVLPRIIIAAILINLSYIICALAVDVSNILGASLRSVFASIQQVAIENGTINAVANVNTGELIASITAAVISGGGAAFIGITIAGGPIAALWMLIPVILTGIIAVVSALITLAARQALIMILIMIAPLAIVAYLLPNTEKWFTKWRDLFMQMLVFYPMFSVLFGASQLAGWAIITSATNWFGVVLGIAVQILPLFFAIPLMKMSKTILGSISTGIQKATAPAQKGIKGWTDSRAARSKAVHFANSPLPSARLMRFLDNRRRKREDDIKYASEKRANEATIYSNRKRNAFRNGRPTADTRRYKQYTKSNFDAEKSTLDLAHNMNKYSDLTTSSRDRRLGSATAESWSHSMLAKDRAVNDDRADIDYLTGKVLEASKGGRGSDVYDQYIQPYGGGLGELGENRLVELAVGRSAKIEEEDRRMAGTLMAKFKFSKTKFRNIAAGYVINDSGKAVDIHGNEIEDNDLDRASKLQRISPDTELELQDIITGETTYRVKLSDKPMMKQLLESDLMINDPGWNKFVENMVVTQTPENANQRSIQEYRSTITQGLLDASYAEHDATYSTMKAIQLKNGYIQNANHNIIADIFSYARTAKADKAMINDPEAIERQFDIVTKDIGEMDADIDTYLDQNGASLPGATRAEKIAYIEKAQTKMREMMMTYAQNITPHVQGNQKQGSAKAFAEGFMANDPDFAALPKNADNTGFQNNADWILFKQKYSKICQKAYGTKTP